MLSIKVWPCFVVNTVYLWCSLQWGLNPDYNVAMLLQPHLSDGLTPIWIDPERSRLDHFLRVYLGNGPLHLVYQSPAGWGGEVQQRSDTDYIRTFLCACGRGCASNRLLTSTSEVLSLSGRLAGAQEETHKQAVCEQESSFPHFASKRAHFSITQENKQKNKNIQVSRPEGSQPPFAIKPSAAQQPNY